MIKSHFIRFNVILIIITSFNFLYGFSNINDFSYLSYNQRFDEVSFKNKKIDYYIVSKKDINAILYILDIAEYNLTNSDTMSYITFCNGHANTNILDMKGSLEYKSILIKDNNRFYQECYSKVISVDSRNNSDILDLTKSILDKASKRYSPDGNNVYVKDVNGIKAKVKQKNSYPYGTADYTKSKTTRYNLNEYKRKEYIRSDIYELTNIVINKDTVSNKSIKINYKNGLYKISFEINLKDKNKRDIATKFAKQNLRDKAHSKDIEYNRYRIEFEIYDNGLIKKFTRYESLSGTLSLGLFNPKGSAQSQTVCYYNWNPKFCNCKAMIKNF